MKDLTIKPEYEILIPPLLKSELDILEADIRKNGIRDPLLINPEGAILDGHNRYRISQKYTLAFQTKTLKFDSKDQELIFILDNQLGRRNITADQRTVLILKKKAMLVKMAKENMRQSKGRGIKVSKSLPTLITREIIGKQAGRSGVHVTKIEKILKVKPELEIEIMQGKHVNINKEYRRIRQAEIDDRIKKEIEQKNPKTLPESVKIANDDFRRLAYTIPDNSVDLIFTDPPYDRLSLPLYRDLAQFASRKLKPNASLITYIGQYVLPEILDIFKPFTQLKYWWMLAVKHSGGTSRFHARQVWVEWKPLLWFVKGDSLPRKIDIHDYIISSTPEKGYHPWAQSTSEAKYVIKTLTLEGAIILDPFMGSGTTGIAAKEINRKFIGFEKDLEKFTMAKSRF